MTEPHDWPFERRAKGTLRPWFFSAMGYLAVLFSDGEEARHAQRGLLEQGVHEGDVRLYSSEDVLNTVSRLDEERSNLAKAVAALTVDRPAKERYLDNARAGGSALWLFAPTEDQADRLVRFLANYDYTSIRYFGDDGVEEIVRNTDRPAVE
jgi:tRNA A58 N-methylase Trm61